MQIKIKTLRLRNFQNTVSLDIDFGDRNVICGRNGSGKTTIANAISWLLYGTASDRTKSFTPKTTGPDGQPVHNLNHSAEAVFTCDDRTFSLKKDYHEVWTVRRGITDAEGNKKREFTGHETDYFIDGKQVKCEEYEHFLSSLFDPQDAKILTLPYFFATELDVASRRQKIISMIGDITPDEVLAEDKTLSTVVDMIKNKGNEVNLASDLKKELADADRMIKAVPVRIDECQRQISESAVEENEDKLASDITELESQIAELEKRRNSLTDSSAISTLRACSLEVKCEMDRIASELETANNQKLNAWRQSVAQYEFAYERAKNDMMLLDQQLKATGNELESITSHRDELVVYLDRIRAAEFNEALPSGICSCCGQPLPADRMEEIRKGWEIRRQDFLDKKHSRIREAEAKLSTTYSEAKAAELTKNKEKLEKRKASLVSQLETTKLDLDSMKADRPSMASVTGNETYNALKKDYDNICASINDEVGLKDAAARAISEQIESLQIRLNEASRKKLQLEINKKLADRIKALADEQSGFMKRAADLKKFIEDIDRYRATRSALFEQKQLTAFEGVYFSFSSDQVNGGKKEECEPFIISQNGNKVSFYKASTSEQINGGLKIINAFSRHMNLSLPVIIDNAEAVNKVVETDGQRILLKVTNSPLEIYCGSGN